MYDHRVLNAQRHRRHSVIFEALGRLREFSRRLDFVAVVDLSLGESGASVVPMYDQVFRRFLDLGVVSVSNLMARVLTLEIRSLLRPVSL